MLPTPTALPPVITAPITINPVDWGMWNYTDEAIQAWNRYPALGVVIQYAIIVIIIVVFVGLMIYLVQDYMDKAKG